jgi:membrane protein DedA with SNARE-associated domain
MDEPWRTLSWMALGVIAAVAIAAFWLWRERWIRRRRRGGAS